MKILQDFVNEANKKREEMNDKQYYMDSAKLIENVKSVLEIDITKDDISSQVYYDYPYLRSPYYYKPEKLSRAVYKIENAYFSNILNRKTNNYFSHKLGVTRYFDIHMFSEEISNLIDLGNFIEGTDQRVQILRQEKEMKQEKKNILKQEMEKDKVPKNLWGKFRYYWWCWATKPTQKETSTHF